jgi:hypothetical protein
MTRANPTTHSFFPLPVSASITPTQWPVTISDNPPPKQSLKAINQIESRMTINAISSIEAPTPFAGKDLNL